jgi:hypothetical protein
MNASERLSFTCSIDLAVMNNKMNLLSVHVFGYIRRNLEEKGMTDRRQFDGSKQTWVSEVL